MSPIYKFALFVLTLFPSIFLSGQNTFRYQAVARNSTGTVIANQAIGVQISIIQNAVNNPPIYAESHLTESNDYGVINLNVGEGIASIGYFEDIDWSLASFIRVELDITGGTNYQLSSTSEILSVPRALYAVRAGSISGVSFGLYVTNFGAKGDGVADDTDAFENAIDSAAITGSVVLVPAGIYRLTRSLTVPNGVSISGEGMGSEPLQTPYNGSLIKYEGNNFAIIISGHTSGLRDLTIRDNSGNTAIGGVLVKAQGRLVENVLLSNVLISGFINGTALKLQASNNGGIAYATFYNVRIRHAKTGIHIIQDNNSFVNSNSFYSGVISGGAFDFGILVEGGNNNIFYSTIIEPPVSTIGHFVVKKGEVQGYEIRIEGSQQSPAIPLILFEPGTQNSELTGTYAGGLTLDKGNNFINMKSGKAIHYRNSGFNRFKNPHFLSVDGTSVFDWEVKGNGNGFTTEVLDPQLTPTHYVLKVTIPAGKTVDIKPAALASPEIKELAMYKQVNFGFHIKTSVPGAAFTMTNAPNGWTNSTPHSGSGEWEFIGMNALVNNSQQPVFQLRIDNPTGSAIEVLVTTPTLAFGNQLPILDAAPLTTSGGTINGLLTMTMTNAVASNNSFIVLPRIANYFEINSTQTITRINFINKDRFPQGSVITLLFNLAGTNVTNNAYIKLKSGFTSIANGSLTLISLGDGTWREVSRSN